MSTPDPVRIGNREREAAVRELGEHFAEGRLDPEEYEQRASAAYAARTADDLAPLFADLPRPGAARAVAPPAPPPRAAARRPPAARAGVGAVPGAPVGPVPGAAVRPIPGPARPR